jgi:hypothetical protein
MQIGCLGDIAFKTSADMVRTVNDVTWSGSANYNTHSRHLTNALTEFTGLAPDEMTFEIVLSAFLGVNPMDDLTKLWEYERKGQTLPLVIGSKAYGKYRWTIKSHKIKMETFSSSGDLMSATVSVSLLEYVKR